MSQSIDCTAAALRQEGSPRPEHLPHGLITPPPEVQERLALEKTRFLPESLNPGTEERLLNDWTLGYYFDQLGHEVLYRPTSQGPMVLAVGFDEIQAFRRGVPSDQDHQSQTWLPY